MSEDIKIPYELSEGWKRCRLGDVAETLTGSISSKKIQIIMRMFLLF